MCDSAKKPQRIIKDFLNALFCFGGKITAITPRLIQRTPLVLCPHVEGQPDLHYLLEQHGKVSLISSVCSFSRME